MCDLAGIGRAGYYRGLAHSEPAAAEMELRHRLQDLALNHPHYGYRRLTALLRREGHPANHKRVLRLTRLDNLLCLRAKRFVPPTTDSDHAFPVHPNLARRLRLTGINQLWVADITYIRLQRQFAFLAVILDAFSRRAVGWAMAEHLQATLPLAALERALATRAVSPGGLVHHSDRGVQYACAAYRQKLAGAGILPSMSRIGCPWDNAMVESFMKTLKAEEVDGRAYADIAEAQAAIGRFIEETYNRRRLHSALAYATPAEFEANQPQPQIVAA